MFVLCFLMDNGVCSQLIVRHSKDEVEFFSILTLKGFFSILGDIRNAAEVILNCHIQRVYFQ